MYAAEVIKHTLNFDDILNTYGFELNRAGYINCPFHSEKTASLRIHKNKLSFKCYGCGEQGTFIDFVSKLFNLDFRQAVEKIDYDFHLGILNVKRTYKEAVELKKRMNELKQRRAEAKKKQAEAAEIYNLSLSVFALYEQLLKRYSPKSAEAEWSEEFKELLNMRPLINYIFDTKDVSTD